MVTFFFGLGRGEIPRLKQRQGFTPTPSNDSYRLKPRGEKVRDFESFWAAYPRKINKKKAQLAWVRLLPDQQFVASEALPVHVRFWQMAATPAEFIPHCATWLNQERWTDELEVPQPAKAENEWWRSKAGIEAKAKEMGMWPPRTGEDWHSLKARLLAKAAA